MDTVIEKLYRAMRRIRLVEEEIARVYPTDQIKSPVHLAIGQESVAVGVCAALQPVDVVFGTYRSHATYLAKGGYLPAMIAELFGKATGCCCGKGGSMHLADAACGMLGTSAIVGTSLPIAVGYALAERMRSRDTVVTVFFGDGATEEGVFWETLNFAALHSLPVLFVCENNLYAIHAHQQTRQARCDLAGKVAPFGLPAIRTSPDPLKIRAAVLPLVERMRNGGGPAFLECMTYRWREHVGPGQDFHLGYRPEAECAPWIAEDPVAQYGALLEPRVRAALEETLLGEIREAFDLAEKANWPAESELTEHVYA